MVTLNDTGKGCGILMKAGLITVFVSAYFIIHTGIIFAAGTALLDTLRSCEIDVTTNIFRDGFRMIGFGILKGLGKLSDGLYDSLTYIFESIDITYSSGIGALVKKYQFVYKLLFTISVAAFGLYLVARTNTGQLNTINCLMLIFLILAAMPLMTEKLAKLTDAGTGYAQSKWQDSAEDMDVESISGSVMKDYIIDLDKVDKDLPDNNTAELKKAVNKKTGYNDFRDGGKDWRYIDINEPMNYNDDSYEKDVWDKKLEGSGDEKAMVDLGASWINKLDIYYYRYQITSWILPILMMLVLCVVFLFSGFRCAALIIEIIQAEIYMPFVAVTDLASGQRIKEGLKHFLTLFAGIFLCVALLGIYFICYGWINVNIDNTTAQIVFHLALAWAVLNGPNAIERILGIDVGVKDGWKILLGLNAAKATGAAGMAAVAAAGKAITAPAHAVKWGMDKKEQAHGAMDQAKEKMEQYRQQNAEAKSEAEKWKPAGEAGSDPMAQSQNEFSGSSDDTHTAADPMAQTQNGAAGNPDPMSEKDNGAFAVGNADKMQTAGDPMAQPQNDAVKGADPMAAKPGEPSGADIAHSEKSPGRIAGDPNQPHTQGNADPMGRRTTDPVQQSRGSVTGTDMSGNTQAISPENIPGTSANTEQIHTYTAEAKKDIPGSKTVILDGKPIDLKKANYIKVNTF